MSRTKKFEQEYSIKNKWHKSDSKKNHRTKSDESIRLQREQKYAWTFIGKNS